MDLLQKLLEDQINEYLINKIETKEITPQTILKY